MIISVSFISGVMVGLEFLLGEKALVVDLGIFRIIFALDSE